VGCKDALPGVDVRPMGKNRDYGWDNAKYEYYGIIKITTDECK
jgi:hypothetical protein